MNTKATLMEVNCQNLLKAIGSFRYEVWKTESKSFADVFPLGIWLDPDDMISKHFAVICDGQIVASARVSLHERLGDIPDFTLYQNIDDKFVYPIASFNRLVVKREYRQRGFASLLVEARLKYAQKHAKGAVCIGHGRQAVRLQKFGFKEFGLAEKYSTLYKTFPEDSSVLYHDLKDCRPSEKLSKDSRSSSNNLLAVSY